MGVERYKAGKRTFWRADYWLTFPDGRKKRKQVSKIPTKELAERLIQKEQLEAFEGEYFEKRKPRKFTVAMAWENYRTVSKRQNKPSTYARNEAIMPHLIEHLGEKQFVQLNQAAVDAYRTRRESELVKGRPPAPATLNREVAFLKRLGNYAVKRGDISQNPLSRVEMLEENNVRQVAIDEEEFQLLYEKAENQLRPIIVMAYETGMRRGELLALKWNQVDLKAGKVELAASDTKSKKPRTIILTDRVLKELETLPRSLTGYVFFNPITGKRWYDLKKVFDRARKAAGLSHIRFHDLRRSFVTNARKRGIPESVVMRMSGHKTRSVFERYNVVDEEDLVTAKKKLEQGRNIELQKLEQNETNRGEVDAQNAQ